MVAKIVPTLDYSLPFKPFLRQLEDIDHEIRLSGYNKHKKENQDFYFYYIPIPSHEVIHYLLKEPGARFLDVGCGSGRVLALRKYLTGSPVFGIELLPEIAEMGSRVYDVPIEIGDAFEIISSNFLERFQVVYTYMPIADMALMLKLHNQIGDCKRKQWHLRIEMMPSYMPNHYKNPGFSDVYFRTNDEEKW